MAAKRGQQNLAAVMKKDAAVKKQKLLDEQKKKQDKQKKTQDKNPASLAPDNTMEDFLLLQEAPTLGSEPSSSAVTLTPSVLHGDQRAPETAAVTTPTCDHGANSAPETAADTNVGITSAEDGRRHSSRIANAIAKPGGGKATQGSSDILQDEDDDEDENADDVREDEDEIRSNTTGQGRTPTKPFAVEEKRGRGRPYKSPSQQGVLATYTNLFLTLTLSIPNPYTMKASVHSSPPSPTTLIVLIRAWLPLKTKSTAC